MKKKIYLSLGFLLLIMSLIVLKLDPESFQQKNSQKAFHHEVIVTLKLVQVYVTDKNGNPVTDLTKDDFILYDNRRLQRITDFEKHFLFKPEIVVAEELEELKETALAPARKIPSRMNRKFFFFIDVERNGLRGLKKSKEAASHFIETKVQPSDEVAVLSYSSMAGLVLHEYLTTDHKKVREVIKGLRLFPEYDGELWKGNLQGKATLTDGINLVEEAKDKLKDDQLEFHTFTKVTGHTPIVGDELMQKILANKFIFEMKALAKSLRHIPGYKNIVFFSTGIVRDFFYRDHEFRKNYQEMSKEFSASNCPIYSVNTESMSASLKGGGYSGDHSLKQLASHSGGKYFGNIDSQERIAVEIQKITSNYYVLGYYVDEKWDGKYHKIKVDVKRKGCHVYAQSGYFNPKPFTEFTEFEKRLHLVDLALSENPYFQPPLNFPLIANLCSYEKEFNVVLLSEVPVERINEVLREKTEIITLIFDEKNNIIDSRKAEIDFSTLPEKKIYLYTISSLPPGSYECRVVIRNLFTGRGAVASSSIVIPDESPSGIKIFPPLLLIPAKESYYLNISDEDEKKERESPSIVNFYPFNLSQTAPLVEELEQGESKLLAVIRCSIIGIQEPNIELTVHLIQHLTGQKTPLSSSILYSKKEEGTFMFLIGFQLPKLQLGRYSIEIIAEEPKSKLKSHVNAVFTVK